MLSFAQFRVSLGAVGGVSQAGGAERLLLSRGDSGGFASRTFREVLGLAQVEEVGPGESARARQDRATGSRDWGAGARAEGAGPAGAGLAGAGLAGERRTAGEGMGGRHLVERWAQKGSLSWRIPAHRILPLPPVFFSS